MIYELQDAGALQGNFKRYIVFNSVWAFLPHNWKWNKYQNWKKYLDLLCSVNLHHIQCLVEISVLEFLFWKKREKLVFTAFHTQGHSWVHITCLCSSQIQTHTRSSLAVAQWDEINKVLASPAGYFLCNFMWFIYLFSSSLRGS